MNKFTYNKNNNRKYKKDIKFWLVKFKKQWKKNKTKIKITNF
jgi:hypothetical protein